jgi:pimeloyl-ACP methyl ester carboxylesterase
MNAAGVVGSELTPFERNLQEGRNTLIAHDIKGVLDLLGSTIASRTLPLLMTPFAYWDVVSRRHVNQHIFRQLLEYAPAPDQPSFSAISAPTLILWGDQDEIIHSSCAHTFKALIPHAEIKSLPGVGHMPMVEKPVKAAKLLKRFWLAAQ